METSFGLANGSSSQRLFEDVSYVILGDTDDKNQSLDTLLKSHGARRHELDSNGRIGQMTAVTHIFTTSIDFPDYEACLDQLKAVVKPSWAHVSVAKGRQQNPRQYNPDPAMFMNDVVVFASGIPEGDKEAIYGGVMAMGGLCLEHFTKLCTHLVVLSADDAVCDSARRKGVPCKMVLPHWFDDCLRLRRRISEAPYLLPDAEILRAEHADPPTPRVPRQIGSAVSPAPEGSSLQQSLREAPETMAVFADQKFMLSRDLNISDLIRKSIRHVISRGGGQVVDAVEEADYLVCHFRESEDFVKFWRRNGGQKVGNLSWLYHLIVHNRWVSPLNKLLHYPIPQRGIPGFENFIICISNYTGNARIYVENLVKITGAKFTKTMAQENTHLVTAHTESEKCDAAKEWNINIVNHLWIEDSYAKMKVQTLTFHTYTHFPSRTNLGEIVGNTPIDRSVIGKWIEANYPEATSQRPVVVAPTVINKRIASLPIGTPSRRTADGKENQQPLTPSSGSRSAKSKALSKLHDAALDMAKYEKEKKRVGGVTHGRERKQTESEDRDTTKKPSPKRTHEETEEEEAEADADADGLAPPPEKRAKGRKGGKLRVMVSKYERWQSNPERQQADKNKLRNLGITIIDDPSPSGFLLCVPGIIRTQKFVSALAYGPDVVSTSFLDHCLDKKELADPDDFMLHDVEGEQANDMSLSASLRRARENDGKLLQDWQVFCTQGVKGGFDTYKTMVEVNGGSCYLFQNKTNMKLAKPASNDDEMEMDSDGDEDMANKLFLISGTAAAETKLWPLFRQMAEKADMEPVIVKTDWILGVAMNQRLVWKDEWAL